MKYYLGKIKVTLDGFLIPDSYLRGKKGLGLDGFVN